MRRTNINSFLYVEKWAATLRKPFFSGRDVSFQDKQLKTSFA